MTDLSNNVIFITGAASGIGAATARLCREAGAKIVGADLNAPTEHCDLALACDVTDEAAVKAACDAAIEEFGKVDGILNSAGIIGLGITHGMDMDYFNKVQAIHVGGPMLVGKYLFPHMMEAERGSVVNITSIYGLTGGVGQTPYAVAKAAVLQLTRTMAANYARYNIRVNSVAPGVIETPMTSILPDGPRKDGLLRMHLLNRAGQPEEVAKVIRFLLSDDASYVTADNWCVDGGFSGAKISTDG